MKHTAPDLLITEQYPGRAGEALHFSFSFY